MSCFQTDGLHGTGGSHTHTHTHIGAQYYLGAVEHCKVFR